MSELPFSKFKIFSLILLFGSSIVMLGLKELNKHQHLRNSKTASQLSFEEGSQLIIALHGAIDPTKGRGNNASVVLAPSEPKKLTKIFNDDSVRGQLSADPNLTQNNVDLGSVESKGADAKNINQNGSQRNSEIKKTSIFTKIKRLFSK